MDWTPIGHVDEVWHSDLHFYKAMNSIGGDSMKLACSIDMLFLLYSTNDLSHLFYGKTFPEHACLCFAHLCALHLLFAKK